MSRISSAFHGLQKLPRWEMETGTLSRSWRCSAGIEHIAEATQSCYHAAPAHLAFPFPSPSHPICTDIATRASKPSAVCLRLSGRATKATFPPNPPLRNTYLSYRDAVGCKGTTQHAIALSAWQKAAADSIAAIEAAFCALRACQG